MRPQKSLEELRTQIENWFNSQSTIQKVGVGNVFNLDPSGDDKKWPRLHTELLGGGLREGSYNLRMRFYFADLLDGEDVDFLVTWPVWSDLIRIAYDFRMEVLICGGWTDEGAVGNIIPDKNGYNNNLAVIAFEQDLSIGVMHE